MKKKSVFRKIAFLLTIALVVNLGVFDYFTIMVKAEDTLPNQLEFTVRNGESYTVGIEGASVGFLTVERGGSVRVTPSGTLTVSGSLVNYGTVTLSSDSSVSNVINHGIILKKGHGTFDPYELVYLPDVEIEGDMTQDGKYKGNTITLVPPDGYQITVSDPSDSAFNGSMWGDEVTINPSVTSRYWLKADNTVSSAVSVPSVEFKNYADEPANGKYYVIDNPENYDSEGNFYWDRVVLAPPSGYDMISVSQSDSFSSYNPSISFVSPVRGYKAKLQDSIDRLPTAGEGNIENIDVLPYDCYDIEGTRLGEDDDNPNKFYQAARIVAGDNCKILLASEYSANGTNVGKDEIELTSSQNNLKIYVQYYGYWIGPVNVGNITISNSFVPDKAYTLSGKKYKDKYYESDVELIPAEGYKVSLSKDATPTDKLTFTKTTKDVKVYLAYQLYVNGVASRKYVYSDPINVGDIYILRDGEGKVTVDDSYLGGKVVVKPETKTNDVKKVTYKYKKQKVEIIYPAHLLW